MDAANKVGTFFADLISTGIAKASEFVSSTVNFISALPGQVWNAIVGAVANVVSWGAQLLAAGISAAHGLVSGIWDTISQLPGKMLDIGRNLVEGLWNGISNATSWVLDKIRGFGDSIMSGIKSFFGIASPSKLFENEIGKNLALGLGEGFTDSMKNVSKQMQNSIPTEFGVEPTLAIASGAGFQGAQLNSQSHTQPGITVHIENFVNNRAQDVQAFAQELEFYSRRSNFAYG